MDPTEVLDVYTGDSLEDAMAAAVAALGTDLQVRRARKVRSGMRGLMGREVYEVLAAPGPSRAARGLGADRDAVGDALGRLLAGADADDSAPAPSPVTPARRLGRRRSTDAPPSGVREPGLRSGVSGAAAGPGGAAPAGAAGPGGGRRVSDAPPPADPGRTAAVAPSPAPAARAVPAERTAPAARAVPAERTAPAARTVPAERTAPAARAVPAGRTAPARAVPAAGPARPPRPATTAPVEANDRPASGDGVAPADGAARPARTGTAAPTAGAAPAAEPSDRTAARAARPSPAAAPAARAAATAGTPSGARAPRTAAPGGRSAPAGPLRRRTAAPARSAALEGEVLPPLPADPAANRPLAVRSRPASRTAPGAAPHPDPAVAEHTLPASSRAAAPGWDRRALRRLGVPLAVLHALPQDDPRDDLGWLNALTAAIGSTVPAPATVGPAHPVVVDGYGLEGAVGILQAGVKGSTPGTLVLDGRAAPASAVELALVLRTHVTGG